MTAPMTESYSPRPAYLKITVGDDQRIPKGNYIAAIDMLTKMLHVYAISRQKVVKILSNILITIPAVKPTASVIIAKD